MPDPRPSPHELRRLDGPERLEVLRRTDLLDSSADAAFDRLTRLVTRTLGVPVSLVSLVDDSRQFFKSAVGLPADWAAARGTPLSRSFCQHVVTADAPLVVPDAREDERVSDNPAIEEADVVAYLGAPVRGPGGVPIGSLCAISPTPRQWTQDELLLVTDLAAAASDLVALRTAAAERQAAVVELSHEVRTGFAALQMEADTAAAAVDDEDVRAAVQRVAAALQEHAATVTGGLGRLERGAVGVERDVDVVQLLERVAEELRAAGQLVTVDAPDDTGVVRADEPELHRVVRSVAGLLLAHGAGTVTLTAHGGDGSVRLRVADDAADALAEPARWLLTGRTDGGGAAGSLAQRAAQRLGGRLVLTGTRPNVVDLLVPRRRD